MLGVGVLVEVVPPPASCAFKGKPQDHRLGGPLDKSKMCGVAWTSWEEAKGCEWKELGHTFKQTEFRHQALK